MNVSFDFGTVSGLFDVPLDDPKQRFSQRRIFFPLPRGRNSLDFAVHPVLKVNAKRRVIKVIRVQRYKPSLVTMSW